MAQRKGETREQYNARRAVAQAVYNEKNREQVRASNRRWYRDNKPAKRAYAKKLYATSPKRRMGQLLRSRLNLAIKGLGRPSMEQLLGCTMESVRGTHDRTVPFRYELGPRRGQMAHRS